MPLQEHEKKWFHNAELGDLSAMKEQCSSMRSPKMRIHVGLKDLSDRNAMHVASENGHAHVVSWLLAEGCKCVEPDASGKHPLHVAAAQGHSRVISLLIDEGNAALEAKDRSGCTPLWLAVSANRMQAVQQLLAYGASPNVSDFGLLTPLHSAASNGRLELVRLLLEHRGDIDAKDKRGNSVIAHATERVRSMIWFHSAEHGDLPRLRHLLARTIGAEDDEGIQPNALATYLPHSLLTSSIALVALKHCTRCEILLACSAHGLSAYFSLVECLWFSRVLKSPPRMEQYNGFQRSNLDHAAFRATGWKNLGRALYQPEGQDVLLLNLHKVGR